MPAQSITFISSKVALYFFILNATNTTPVFRSYFQTGESFHVKVVELEPKLSFLGANLDEAVLLQKQHDELLTKLEVSSFATEVAKYFISIIITSTNQCITDIFLNKVIWLPYTLPLL